MFGRKPCKIDVFQLSVFAAMAKKKMTIRYKVLLSPAEMYETFRDAFEN